RRRIRQRGALSCPQPGAAARAVAIARDPEAARRPVRLEPAWPQRGRLEPRPLRRLSRSRELAPLHVSRRVRRADSLLPPFRPAARAAALARERLAQTGVKLPPRNPAPSAETSLQVVSRLRRLCVHRPLRPDPSCHPCPSPSVS